MLVNIKRIITCILTLISPLILEAGGWGKLEDEIIFEGSRWKDVYIDIDDLYLEASIPNYAKDAFRDGNIYLQGKTGPYSSYVITTSYAPEFASPRGVEDFYRTIYESYPGYSMIIVHDKSLGGLHVLDLVPSHSNNVVYWRFLCTKNRLIKMGTTDPNPTCRIYFFDSIHIN